MKCQGCGTEGVTLINVECEPTAPDAPWKLVTVCSGCVDKLDADMWISERCWNSISPVVRFADLPDELPDTDDPTPGA